jgi:hypothetical protein
MNSYTVRIELHSDNYTDFINLHTEMIRSGFSRTIVSGKGVIYQLPRAVYTIESWSDSKYILSLAQKAVNATKKTAEILVAKTSGWAWSGLSTVK